MSEFDYKYCKKDKWYKDIRKSVHPEILADLIEKRLYNPAVYGPYVRTTLGECPADIIVDLLNEQEDYAVKLIPAIGLVLYKNTYDKTKENHDTMRGIFYIIRKSGIVDCQKLLYAFLKEKSSNKELLEDKKWRITYRDAMMAYAIIQPRNNKATEYWWYKMWLADNVSSFWIPSFLGLRIQNPNEASTQIPLLIRRNLDKVATLLVGSWNDQNARRFVENIINKGINDEYDWAGTALNILLSKLIDKDRDILMCNLNSLNQI